MTYTYDAQGNLASTTDAAGTTSVTRDAAGRVTGYTEADGSAEAATVGLPRNMMGLIQQVDLPTGGAVAYGYDAEGRKTGITLPTGEVLSSTYDDHGRLLTVSGGVDGAVSYSYDNNENMTGYTVGGQDHPVRTMIQQDFSPGFSIPTAASARTRTTRSGVC